MLIEVNSKLTEMDRKIHHTAEQPFGFSLNLGHILENFKRKDVS